MCQQHCIFIIAKMWLLSQLDFLLWKNTFFVFFQAHISAFLKNNLYVKLNVDCVDGSYKHNTMLSEGEELILNLFKWY